MKKKDFKRIGIDEDSNQQRSKRVMFAISSIEQFEQANEFGNPLLNGYELNEHMKCVPTRYTKVALPEEILKSVGNVNREPLEVEADVCGAESDEEAEADEEEISDEEHEYDE